ncbi:MAG TPA: hypothetical protein GXX36_14720 [Clostridiaceae bacterium]|nr:hypothetical protein [Clostridiaceae bacterium]
MKKVFIIAAASIIIFFVGYHIVSNIFNEHTRINAGEVQSITINNITLEAESNPKEIAEFMQIYNKARASDKIGDTTPSYFIVINLKNGKKIDMLGTTQGFHYVNNGEKSYKISSADMTYYLKDIVKQSRNNEQ